MQSTHIHVTNLTPGSEWRPYAWVAMDDFKTCRLDDAPAAAIFVVETIENAQPAEAAGTCLRFYNRKRKGGEKGLFAGKLRYAVLGLGDTNLLVDRKSTTAKD